MGIKQRLIKAIAPRVVSEVMERQDEIIDACMVCKGNDGEAIKECEFWMKKKIYRCEKIADLLDDAIYKIKTDALEPAMNASNTIHSKLEVTGEKFKALKEKVLKNFKKK